MKYVLYEIIFSLVVSNITYLLEGHFNKYKKARMYLMHIMNEETKHIPCGQYIIQ